MANGRVLTGFSKPYVAVYSNNGTTITYSNGAVLARGVSVTIEPETGDSNDFYADNEIVESVAGAFTGGTLTLTVDGLQPTAERTIYGLPTAESVTIGGESVSVQRYDDNTTIPFVGVGFIARYMSGGVTEYVPIIINKARFTPNSTSANTAGESIDWQTQELTANIYRADDTTHTWKQVGEGLATEAKAEAVIKNILSIS